MKAFAFIKRFKKTVATMLAVFLIFTVTLASGSDWFYTLTIATKLVMKASTSQTFAALSNQVFATTAYSRYFGSSYIKTGDSTVIKAGKTLARIDSFYTTAASDSVQWLGARAGDVFSITGYRPAYSTAIDTVVYSYMVGIDTVYVFRVKSYSANVSPAPAAVKSGGQYAILGLSKQ